MRHHPVSVALIALAVSVALVACTKTVYVVQNDRGELIEVPPPDDEVEVDAGDGVVVYEDDVVEVSVIPSSEYILVEPWDETVYLEVDIFGQQVGSLERAPMNLALVVDRSGSMQGEKLRHAKAAAHSLIADLHDGDRVALLSYASDVVVEVGSATLDEHSRGVLGAAIEHLEAAGGTFLAGGLEHGAREVADSYDVDALARVILVSDGRPTVGTSQPWALERAAARWYEEGVSVTTMGVGYDYNEDLMTALAIAGGGNYYYVERPHEMAETLGHELSHFGRTVARDVELVLDVPDGVRVKEVFGYRHERRGDDVVVRMSSLAAGQKRRLLMALDVPRGARGRDLTLTTGRLRFRDEVRGARRDVRLPAARVAYTDDARLVRRTTNPRVVEKLERVRNAQVRHEVMGRLDRGDTAGAVRIVRQRLDAGRRAARTYQRPSLAREVTALEGLAEEVQSAPPPTSPRYEALKKRHKAQAFDALMH